MPRIFDFHSHVLPRVDDGSASLGESIAMLQAEADQGISCVVATPHFYAQRDRMEEFLERRAEAEKRLRSEMENHDGLPQLVMGAEVLYFSGISEAKAIRDLTIGETDYILIEMPMPPWKDEVFRELEQIHSRLGLVPIIAHIDRYIGPFRTFGIPKKLEQLPVLIQANAEFFLDRHTASMALRMLRSGQIHLLGSDCHSMGSRCPNLGNALARITDRLGEAALDQIVQCQQLVFPS